MNDTLKLAWRNLGRNLRRTLATMAALTIGISLCVASYGLMDGLSEQMLHSLTRLDLGHVQVHSAKFVERRQIQSTMAKPDAIIAAAERLDRVQGVAPRVYAYALVGSKHKSSGVELVGVDPAREPQVTELHTLMKEGQYLDAAPTPWPRGRALTAAEKARDADITASAEQEAFAEIEALGRLDGDAAAPASARPGASGAARVPPAARGGPTGLEALGQRGGHPPVVPPHDQGAARAAPKSESGDDLAHVLSPPPDRPPRVILGASLAKVLGAKIGSRLYVSTLAVNGESESVFLQVAGIFQTGSQLYDRNRIYLHIADLRRLTHLGTAAAHEISLVLDRIARARAAADALRAQVGGEHTVVRAWNAIRPDMEQMMALNDVSTDLMVFIIFVVATLGVVNTMLMSVFERTRELGVLKAIGMAGRRIVTLIMTETLLLVLLASVAGTVLGLGLDLYMVRYGFDLSSITGGLSIGGVGINPVIHGAISARGLVMPTVVLAICCVLASIYPAVRAARMQPAVGMRDT